jgi:hypothetical protein
LSIIITPKIGNSQSYKNRLINVQRSKTVRSPFAIHARQRYGNQDLPYPALIATIKESLPALTNLERNRSTLVPALPARLLAIVPCNSSHHLLLSRSIDLPWQCDHRPSKLRPHPPVEALLGPAARWQAKCLYFCYTFARVTGLSRCSFLPKCSKRALWWEGCAGCSGGVATGQGEREARGYKGAADAHH